MKRFRAWWATPKSSVIVHRTLKWVWIFPGIPVSMLLRYSVPYLVAISVYTVIVGHWGSEQAALAQLQVEKEDTDE
jgi:hypothetical protein